MYTYQDLEAVQADSEQKTLFVQSVITEYKGSEQYRQAAAGKAYASGHNLTIDDYKRIINKLSGAGVEDVVMANHKCKTSIFKRVITQEAAYLTGNGVAFEQESTKERLGGVNLDPLLYRMVKSALAQGVAYGFWDYDRLRMFTRLEFAPLFDEDTGAIRAGVRFFQIADDKPLKATLFELDGFTKYENKKGKFAVVQDKRPYIKRAAVSKVGGVEAIEGRNYPDFPIIPLYGNLEGQSELVGKREQIDSYDLIKSGFANDLDDASMIYWIVKNAGGMEDADLAAFVKRLKTIGAASIPNADEGATAEQHTADVPYQSREVYLSRIERDLYRDFMAFDAEQVAAGAVTATQIQAAYELLNEKTDELEMCLHEFFNSLLAIVGIDDQPKFKPSQVSNMMERTQMVMMCSGILGEEGTLMLLPFLTEDEKEEIMQKKIKEEADRYEQGEAVNE